MPPKTLTAASKIARTIKKQGLSVAGVCAVSGCTPKRVCLSFGKHVRSERVLEWVLMFGRWGKTVTFSSQCQSHVESRRSPSARAQPLGCERCFCMFTWLGSVTGAQTIQINLVVDPCKKFKLWVQYNLPCFPKSPIIQSSKPTIALRKPKKPNQATATALFAAETPAKNTPGSAHPHIARLFWMTWAPAASRRWYSCGW